MESFLVTIFTWIGCLACCTLTIYFAMIVIDSILNRWNRLWETSKYAYDIIMCTWREIRRYFLKGTDRYDYIEYKSQSKAFQVYLEQKDAADDIPTPTENENSILERINILEDGIKQHQMDCPDDDYEPDHALWALVEDI